MTDTAGYDAPHRPVADLDDDDVHSSGRRRPRRTSNEIAIADPKVEMTDEEPTVTVAPMLADESRLASRYLVHPPQPAGAPGRRLRRRSGLLSGSAPRPAERSVPSAKRVGCQLAVPRFSGVEKTYNGRDQPGWASVKWQGHEVGYELGGDARKTQAARRYSWISPPSRSTRCTDGSRPPSSTSIS